MILCKKIHEWSFFVMNDIFLKIKTKYITMLKKYHRGIDRLTDIVYNDIRETIDFFSRFLHTDGGNVCM